MNQDKDPRPVFVAHDIEDLFNALPTFLGFQPEDSVVAVATEGPRRRFGFRMRLDVPDDPAPVDAVASVIVHHLDNNCADGAIVLALTNKQDIAREVLAAVETELDAAGIEPIVLARSNGQRYWVDVPGFPADGIGYATSDHHVSIVSAVAAGQEILPDRDALARRVAGPTAQRCEELDSVYASVWEEVLLIMCEHPRDLGRAGLADLEVVIQRVEDGVPLDDAQTVRLCIWLNTLETRDAVWNRIDETTAERWLHALSHCSRQSVDIFAAPVLTVTAYAAWLTGNGALASICVDRALALDPHNTAAGLMGRLLEQGTAPPGWRRRFEARRAG